MQNLEERVLNAFRERYSGTQIYFQITEENTCTSNKFCWYEDYVVMNFNKNLDLKNELYNAHLQDEEFIINYDGFSILFEKYNYNSYYCERIVISSLRKLYKEIPFSISDYSISNFKLYSIDERYSDEYYRVMDIPLEFL